MQISFPFRLTIFDSLHFLDTIFSRKHPRQFAIRIKHDSTFVMNILPSPDLTLAYNHPARTSILIPSRRPIGTRGKSTLILFCLERYWNVYRSIFAGYLFRNQEILAYKDLDLLFLRHCLLFIAQLHCCSHPNSIVSR